MHVGKISEHLEDYLERIFEIIRTNGIAKMSDVAQDKGVAKSSVNNAVRRLSDKGLVTHDRYKNINLTDRGARLASELSRRHDIIKQFLTSVVGVSPKIADQDACAIEHHLHAETLNKLIEMFETHKS